MIQPITLGPTSGDRVAVQSGLSVGDKVVTDGADRLRNGTRVSLAENSVATSPKGNAGSSGKDRGNGANQ
jgi:multidrug efflux system membrane fusion protein